MSADAVEDIVLRATGDLANFGHLTRPTLSHIEGHQSWDDNIIYAILHEPIYCEGYDRSLRLCPIRLIAVSLGSHPTGPLTGFATRLTNST